MNNVKVTISFFNTQTETSHSIKLHTTADKAARMARVYLHDGKTCLLLKLCKTLNDGLAITDTVEQEHRQVRFRAQLDPKRVKTVRKTKYLRKA